MPTLHDVNCTLLQQCADEIRSRYNDVVARHLSLDLTRGKPSTAQLDLSNTLLGLPGEGNARSQEGIDTRNYGGLTGLTDIRAIFAEALGLPVEQLYAGDASSLNVEFDVMSWAYTFGTVGSLRPWSQEEKLRWICLVPGYDRHFSITELFGFEMACVNLTEDGPDMDAIRELVKDPSVKGMWVVPVYSNPTGYTLSKEVCEELASMPTAAPDFRIMWDNAYALHVLAGESSSTDAASVSSAGGDDAVFPVSYNVIEMAEKASNPDRFWYFASTSKITFAGSGVAFFASSRANLDWYASIANIRGIGPNKVNQLAHANYFGDADGVRSLMRQHAGIMRPKFDRVVEILDSCLSEFGVATWTNPRGGYFISLDVVDGTAARVVQLAREAGISLTAAGSTFPLKQDPNDRNIRLAPSLPPLEEVEVAMDAVATCVLFAALEKVEAEGAGAAPVAAPVKRTREAHEA